MYTTQSLTGIRCGSENNSPWPVRLYNSNWWLFFFLLGTFYRTGLTSWLASSPILMLPIDTISQLVRSDLKLYGFNTFMRDLAQDSNDPDTIELGRRLEIVPANMTVEFLMGQQDTNAFYENKNYLKYLSATVLPNANPWQRLHVMRECLRTFPVAIAMSPGSPFKSEITQIINQMQLGSFDIGSTRSFTTTILLWRNTSKVTNLLHFIASKEYFVFYYYVILSILPFLWPRWCCIAFLAVGYATIPLSRRSLTKKNKYVHKSVQTVP